MQFEFIGNDYVTEAGDYCHNCLITDLRWNDKKEKPHQIICCTAKYIRFKSRSLKNSPIDLESVCHDLCSKRNPTKGGQKRLSNGKDYSAGLPSKSDLFLPMITASIDQYSVDNIRVQAWPKKWEYLSLSPSILQAAVNGVFWGSIVLGDTRRDMSGTWVQVIKFIKIFLQYFQNSEENSNFPHFFSFNALEQFYIKFYLFETNF